MTYTEDEKWLVFQKTDGRCRYCGKLLAYSNHGVNGARGSWHIDHSYPKSKGGADSYDNFWPACIHCNLQKSDGSARAFRNRTRSQRATRQKKAVLSEVKADAFPLSMIAFAGISTVLESGLKFRDATNIQFSDPDRARSLRQEAWWTLLVGIVLLVIAVAIVYSINRSHKID